MALKCKSCGGRLYYNIDEENLTCEYCSSIFDVADYQVNNAANQGVDYSEGYRMDVFVCRNCGAHLSAPTEQVVAYCNYCGSEALEFQKIEEENKPDGIVPFQISIDEVKQKYREALKKTVFLPEDFLSEEHVSEFRGIYIPYWSTSVDVKSEPFKLKGTKDYYKSGYDYHEEYDIEVAVNGAVDGGFYDASVAFDDTVSAEIAPFKNKPQPFEQGYLAGFYADTVTANKENYREVALDTAVSNISKRISSRVNGAKVSERIIKQNIEMEDKPESKVILFPVWFLTWRKGNRVAYSVMNGQTGKLAIDLPIDYKKFFKSVLIQTIIYFLILSIIPLFHLPLHMASALSVLSYLTMVILNVELRYICRREQHLFDLGDESRGLRKKLAALRKKNGFVIAVKAIWYFFAFIIFMTCFGIETPNETKNMIFFFMLFELIAGIKCAINLSGCNNKLGLVTVAFGLAAQFASFSMAGANHPEDVWYYIIGLQLIASMLLKILTAIYYTNYLTTRPVPNFFSREGGRHE